MERALKTTRPIMDVRTIEDIAAIESRPYDELVPARNLYDLLLATAHQNQARLDHAHSGWSRLVATKQRQAGNGRGNVSRHAHAGVDVHRQGGFVAHSDRHHVRSRVMAEL